MWLLGMPDKEILGSGLPTNGAILRNFMYHHSEEGLSIADSAKRTVDAAVGIWAKARIPTQRADSAMRKLRKLYDTYCLLKKNRLKSSEFSRFNEEQFAGDLDELFDISRKDALGTMKNDEDKQFLLMQQEDPASCTMAGVDKNLSEREARTKVRHERVAAQKRKHEMSSIHDIVSVVPSSSGVDKDVTLDSSDSSCAGLEDSDFQMPSGRKRSAVTQLKKVTKSVITSEVSAALDRVKLPDRGATFVVSAVTQALGCDIDDVSVSRTTIQRARKMNLKLFADAQQEAFSCEQPLLLHWDGKLLPDIAGGTEQVDRIAILVTGGDIEQLLGVPKIARGTGEQQCNACVAALGNWQLKHLIEGMVFDTTASNTGLKKGACALLEKDLGKELVWIACRHHMFEVVLSDVFSVTVGPSGGGPEIELFKRFKKMWPYIDQYKFEIPPDDVFDGMPGGLKEEMKSFYFSAIKSESPREDYRELLQLCFVFLGGELENGPNFRAPGAVHRARWMARAIYALKIFLFRGEIKLTTREMKGLADFSVFVALLYGRFWHEAPAAERAPLNDITLLSLLSTYPNCRVKQSATEAIYRHLWYVSEHLVTLALFDDRVRDETKAQMVANFSRPPNQILHRRLDKKDFSLGTSLEDYVTSRSLKFFDLTCSNGQEAAKTFLSVPPSTWNEDMTFQQMKTTVKKMKVVNDCAERGVALIQSYNNALTKNEDEKQYLLQLVSDHRKKYPKPNKTVLKTTVASTSH